LELRICDLVTNPLSLLAIIAFLEARISQMLANPRIDPLAQSCFSPEELMELCDANENAAAQLSLDATLQHWQDGRKLLARDWIEELYENVYPLSKKQGFSCFLSPLKQILRQGNLAQQWLRQTEQGLSLPTVIQQAIQTLDQEEMMLEDSLCESIAVA
jgi:predicted glutamate--cysteine ligase